MATLRGQMDDGFQWVIVWLKWSMAFLVAQWTGVPAAFQALGVAMLADVVTGVLVAGRRKQLDSGFFKQGLTKKFAIFMIVLLSHHMEVILSGALGKQIEINLESWFAYAYSVGELISIVENCHFLGAPIPAALVDLLLKAKNKVPMADARRMNELDGRQD